MKNTAFKAWGTVLMSAVLAVQFLGCTPKVWVTIPPLVNLDNYRNIGIIEFSANTEDNLNQFTTQRLMQRMQSAQPGIRFLELGTREYVLRSIRHGQLDFEAIKRIGEKYDLDAVLAGELEVSRVTPKIQVSESLTSLKARAAVNAKLSAKLWETTRGAILWNNYRSGTWTVAHMSLDTAGQSLFGISDPKEKYGQMVTDLVNAVTQDFRPTRERRVVRQ